jgi:multimeric flavodoxin WrbA
MAGLYPKVVAADLVVWAVPLVLGAQNALTKKAQDRMIPLLHPYIELVSGESHHRRRYARYPDLALVVEPGLEDGERDVATVRRLFERFALNCRSRLSFFATTSMDPKEAADETRSA